MPDDRSGIVLRAPPAGHVRIAGPDAGGLTRLHYFEGKFLRAAHLALEQRHHRRLVALLNNVGGGGVVEGLDATMTGDDTLRIQPGLAIDHSGRVLHLPEAVTLDVQPLIAAGMRKLPLVSGGSGDIRLYAITIGHAEALCGRDEVHVSPCEDACADEHERAYRVEGIVVRARERQAGPLATSAAVALGDRHLRSLYASAFFAADRRRGTPVSQAALESPAWCAGARFDTVPEVAVALLARRGSSTLFLDPWIVRRELTDRPPRRAWAAAMEMRPWEDLLAEILQFQCQLDDLALLAPRPGRIPNPCAPQLKALQRTKGYVDRFGKLAQLRRAPETAEIRELMLTAIDALGAPPADRYLVDGGIVELPPAGYLPVDPGSTIAVDEQVRRWMGGGVDLSFEPVPADHVADAVEESRHMERISLLRGFDDPRAKPPVEILVPDGRLERIVPPDPGIAFDTRLHLLPEALTAALPSRATFEMPSFAGMVARTTAASGVVVHGAGRGEPNGSSGGRFHFAGATEPPPELDLAKLTHALSKLPDRGSVDGLEDAADAAANVTAVSERPADDAKLAAIVEAAAGRAAGAARVLSTWASGEVGRNPFEVEEDDATRFDLVLHFAAFVREPVVLSYEWRGELRVVDRGPALRGRRVEGHFEGEGRVRMVRRGRPVLDQGGDSSARVVLDLVERDDGTRSLSVRLGDRRDAYTLGLSASWGARPLRVKAFGGAHGNALRAIKNTLVKGGAEKADAQPLFSANADEDLDLRRPSNPLHRTALAALAAIEAALGEPGFSQEAAAKLFPPPPKEIRRLVATRDWVLFHRRRDVECLERTAPPPEPPEPSPPELTLDQKVAESDVGSQTVAIATVTSPAGEPLEHIAVRFHRRGANGPHDARLLTDARGAASLIYTGTAPGVDHIRAFADLDDDGREDPAEPADETVHTWRAVERPVAKVVVTPAEGASVVGTEWPLEALVLDADDRPVAGEEVAFEVTGANAAGGDAPTGEDGVARWAYAGETAGMDDIRARAGGVDALARHECLPTVGSVELSLESSHTVGEEVPVTATVRDRDRHPLADVVVEFRAGPANPANGTATTDADGRAVWRFFKGENAGFDEVHAEAAGVRAAPARHEFVRPRTVAEVRVALDKPTHVTGQPVTATATVIDVFGKPFEGRDVSFSSRGANTADGTKTTGATGQATWSFIGANVGADQVTAAVAGVSSQAAHVYTAPERVINGVSLALDAERHYVGEKWTATATVWDQDGKGMENRLVHFAAHGAHDGAAADLSTDAYGQATWQVAGQKIGTDTIVVKAGDHAAEVTHEFVPEPDPVGVPDVIGQTVTDAERAIREAGYTPYFVRPQDAWINIVDWQDPTAGTALGPGARVRFGPVRSDA